MSSSPARGNQAAPSSSLDLHRFVSSRSQPSAASPVLRIPTARTPVPRISASRAGIPHITSGRKSSSRVKATRRTSSARTATARTATGRTATARTPTGRTATARTATARTSTARTRAQTARCEDSYVVAVIDNPVREVGLCAYDVNGFVVELRQFTDSNLYTTLIKVLCVLSPIEILLSSSSMGGLLVQAIHNSPHVSHIKLTYIGRAFFNETYGELAVEKLSNQQCPHLSRLGSTLYLAVACCGALVKYLEHVEDCVLAPSSLHIHFKPNDGTMFLDMSALEGLEVIASANPALGFSAPQSNACLLRAMDRTVTRAGKRFLRRAVLEPSADIPTISMRQDAVEELTDNNKTYFSVLAALRQFPDLEKSMAIIMNRENARLRSLGTAYEPDPLLSEGNEVGTESELAPEDPGFIHAGPPSPVLIRTILNIKAALEAATELLDITQNLESPLIRGIAGSMRNPSLTKLREEIDDVIDPDIFPNKNYERMLMNGALAVRHGRNGYLDIHRKTMGENVEDMESLADEVRKKHQLHKLELTLHSRRGYHFKVPSKILGARKLPEDFILINDGKKFHHFTSPQMERLNVLYKNSMSEIWRISELELGILVGQMLQSPVITAIHRLCDCIAILDCLSSFVTYATRCLDDFEKPKLTEDGPIDIKQAYHPISLDIARQKPVPNDVFLDETSALHIISGRNQAGKSFFLKTMGLIVIMAHTGCWVPAKYATIRIVKRIATRFETGYDISRQQSSFSKEMQDVSAIFDSVHCSHRSVERALQSQDFMSRGSGLDTKEPQPFPSALILIDELGRYTSTVDGFSIAYAVLEELAAIPNVLTLCTTHFHGLGALAQVNPIVRTFHMVTQHCGGPARNGDDNKDAVVENISYTYKLSTGVLPETSYGMETAQMAGFPENVLKKCEHLKKIIPTQQISTVNGVLESILYLEKSEKNLLRRSTRTVSIANRVRDLRASAECGEEEVKLLVAYQQELLENGKKKREAKKAKQRSHDERIASGATNLPENSKTENSDMRVIE